jgi:transmembrane sensor
MTAHEVEKTDARAIRQQAFDWLIRLNESPETPELRKEFESWLFRSVEHNRTWDKTCLMWSAMGEAQTAHQRLSARQTRRFKRRLPHTSRRLAAVVGGAAILCLAYFALPPVMLRYEADYRTDVAETLAITLEDGSHVLLGPASAITVDVSSASRNVHLLAGEAFFDVVHDASRPFHVTSRDLDVKVLGTAFDVRVDNEGTNVGLEQGSVHATGSVAGRQINETLAPGDQVTVARSDGAMIRNTIPLADIGAWRNNRLIVMDATIGSVIEQIRRYHPSWIVVPESTFAERKVSGVFNLTDPDKALVALVAPYGGHIRKIPGLASIVTAH